MPAAVPPTPSGVPPLEGLAHIALTVTDLPRSVSWYERVLGLEQVVTVPHEGGEGVVLATSDRKVWWALHRHDGSAGEPFSERRTGLDHVGVLVPARDDLDRWDAWLREHGVDHDPPRHLPDFGMSALVLRDPDGIPVELLAYDD